RTNGWTCFKTRSARSRLTAVSPRREHHASTTRSERALDHAAVDAKRGAVYRGSQRARHERDERPYFLGHREAPDQRRGPYFLEELLFELREGLARGFRKRLDEIADAARPRRAGQHAVDGNAGARNRFR